MLFNIGKCVMLLIRVSLLPRRPHQRHGHACARSAQRRLHAGGRHTRQNEGGPVQLLEVRAGQGLQTPCDACMIDAAALSCLFT